MKVTVTEGRHVVFTPSKRTAKSFKKKQKPNYPAIVTDVNENSVDLTVFGVGETIYVEKVAHIDQALENRSSWDWPTRK